MSYELFITDIHYNIDKFRPTIWLKIKIMTSHHNNFYVNFTDLKYKNT